MPRIKFNVEGYAVADLETATDIGGNKIDVSDMDPDKLVEKLNMGDLFIILPEVLDISNDSEIDLFNFTNKEDL